MAKGTVPICIGLYITSDQIIIFQQARFPQDRWMSIRIHQHLGEVAIVRPDKTGRTLESPHMAGHAGPLSLDPVRMVPGRVPYFLREGMKHEACDKFQDDHKETVAGWCSTLTLLLICSSFCREKKGHRLLICSSLSTAQVVFFDLYNWICKMIYNF